MKFKLDVVTYAKEHSNHLAANRFKLASNRVREWRKQYEDINSTDSKKKKLPGGGRKLTDYDVEEGLILWIYERRSNALRVSRKMIMMKAKAMFDENHSDLAVQEVFVGSRGWLEKFMKRNGLSCRRKTTSQLKDPSLLIDKIVAYILHVRRLNRLFSYGESQIIAMDETPVWADMITGTTVEKAGNEGCTAKNIRPRKSPDNSYFNGESRRYKIKAVYCI